jgi:hypothetical protein
VAASSLSELCWVDPDGTPQARGVLALVRDDRPALAFTYADELVARAVARAETVSLVVAEGRSTGGAFTPIRFTGRPRLTEDPAGEVFTADLLTQELRRFPPARVYADSPLLMREHWWYLPRLVVEVDVESVEPISPRGPARDHVLVVAHGSAPVVRQVGLGTAATDHGRGEEQGGARLHLAVEGDDPGHGRAVLLGQDASFPDLEQWAQWRYRGTWDGRSLLVEEAPSRTGLGRPPGLLQRWRRQRALERACVQAIPRARP